jgi:hypothetical protein
MHRHLVGPPWQGYIADVVDARCKASGHRVALKVYSLPGVHALLQMPVMWSRHVRDASAAVRVSAHARNAMAAPSCHPGPLTPLHCTLPPCLCLPAPRDA